MKHTPPDMCIAFGVHASFYSSCILSNPPCLLLMLRQLHWLAKPDNHKQPPFPTPCQSFPLVVKSQPRQLTPCFHTAETRLHSRRNGVEIHGLDSATLVVADPDEVGEVLPGDVAFGTDAERLVAAGVELLDRALETDAQGVGREAEDLADGAGDARAVDVGVVDGCQLGGNLGV